MHQDLSRGAMWLSLAVMGSAAASACGEPATSAEPLPPLAVETAFVRSVTTNERLHAGGVVSARATAILSSRVLAPITAVRVRAGERVRAGQVLVLLDGRDLAAQVHQAVAATASADEGLAVARAELQGALSEHTLATAWHGRITTLHSRNSATAQELEEAQARLSAAAARVDGAKARIAQVTAAAKASRAGMESAMTIGSFATIVAPFDGVVTERLTDPGNLASPGMPLLHVDGDGPSKVNVMVDESRVGHLATGATVEVAIGRGSGDRAGSAEGRVSRISRQVESGSRAFSVEVALPPGITAPSGTFARVTFPGDPRTVLLVPAAAVVRRGQVASAFVVAGDAASLRMLHTGEELSGGIEVLAGLDAGERVVVSPPAGLTDGRRVTLVPAAQGDRK